MNDAHAHPDPAGADAARLDFSARLREAARLAAEVGVHPARYDAGLSVDEATRLQAEHDRLAREVERLRGLLAEEAGDAERLAAQRDGLRTAIEMYLEEHERFGRHRLDLLDGALAPGDGRGEGG